MNDDRVVTDYFITCAYIFKVIALNETFMDLDFIEISFVVIENILDRF